MRAPLPDCIDPEKLARLRAREEAAMTARTKASATLLARAEKSMPGGVPMAWMKGLYRTPVLFITHGEGPRFFDVDGNAYLDFNVADLAMTTGFGTPILAEALAAQARRGTHFLLPTQEAITVCEELVRRIGQPFWQFTLSASGANTEVIRIARAKTGREKILVFGGHYHGHLAETLVAEEGGQVIQHHLGLAPGSADRTLLQPFNDLEAVERALRSEEVALVITEPVLTNCNLIKPDAGYLAGLYELTQKYGSLLCFDEAHTFQFAFGGLTGAWNLDCDFVVLGKGMGTGVSFALYGMSQELGEFCAAKLDVDIGPTGLATGGTIYASTLATTAARIALFELLSEEAYGQVEDMGARLAGGLDLLFAKHALPFKAFHLGPRSGFCLTPELPRNAQEARVSLSADFIDARRFFMANRGLWDAVNSAGPQASFAHTADDIDLYLAAADAFLGEVKRT